jgi:hypothetical protein
MCLPAAAAEIEKRASGSCIALAQADTYQPEGHRASPFSCCARAAGSHGRMKILDTAKRGKACADWFSCQPPKQKRRRLCLAVREVSLGKTPPKGVPMDTDQVRRANLAAIAGDPAPNRPTASGATAPALAGRSGQPALGSASTSCLPARRSAPTTTKTLKRSGSWLSQAPQPLGIRAAKTSSNVGRRLLPVWPRRRPPGAK